MILWRAVQSASRKATKTIDREGREFRPGNTQRRRQAARGDVCDE
ncbi:hypothetical protein RSPO_m01438 (plasmid) [Ralstonia solanacearum Po82]|uniref:Uncharacterized protein n=1 Tax=Ralstonia solanacearum (strain Po82) TaxID=1031711 RepID=F6GBK7_RALS8|nr:hypothetical protein RSPO_m01438 [Ralstonia solanacearum Po82]